MTCQNHPDYLTQLFPDETTGWVAFKKNGDAILRIVIGV
jgi:hypothetical protein